MKRLVYLQMNASLIACLQLFEGERILKKGLIIQVERDKSAGEASTCCWTGFYNLWTNDIG